MKGQTNFILALVFALIVAVFAVINVNPVEVDYLFGTGEAPLILIIIGSVLMGGLITGSFGMVKVYRLQREKKSLEKQLQQYEASESNTAERTTDEQIEEAQHPEQLNS
ncbi:LapA family protein [Pontibacillus litoralis]|uniref:Lipopolysaccharide assembly protein A domain-containing protein n=1 Tax=Pontibacillus litoralis JSM 072002 TaxID=1385512 RepID=A0A0A5HZI4_9BACI|nr:lipopolysaccharide assembly protein LapA domain-containing protein [Pontibacillus litoralis]KGX88987.1 hypothetical protein N784_01230 [Pontibacillus litoralis JSM 072002]